MCSCVELVALVACTLVQGNAVTRALDARQFEAAGVALAAIDDLADLGAAGRAIAALNASQLLLVRRGFAARRAKQPLLGAMLDGFVAASRGDDQRCVELLAPLIDQPALRAAVAGPAGRHALTLCRRGAPGGVAVLERIRRLYPRADWALANLALGARLVGHYSESETHYHSLLALAGRRAWVLNEYALLLQATGQFRRALDVFLEGTRDATDPRGQDTCRGNAALVLLSRNDAGDREMAEALLAKAIERDPTRLRAAYWLAQLRRGRDVPQWRVSPAPAKLGH